MEEQGNNKLLLGILGAIIGAFIGTIPFILVYVFANYIVALLSIIIAIGSFYGYKITKAKFDKKTPYIIAISSILAITVSVFVIIPLALLAREGYGASFENLKIVYELDEMKSAIIQDYLVSLVFTILVISGMIANLRKQVKEGKTGDDIKLNVSNQPVYSEEELQIVKGIFEKNNALDKENGITKDDVIQELSTQIPEIRAKELFNLLKQQGIIRKKSGKFYFFEKAQNVGYTTKKRLAIFLIVFVVTFVIIFGVAILGTMADDKNKSKNKSSKSNSSISLNEDNDTQDEDKDSEDDYDMDFESEKEYIITEAGIKFIPTDDLIMVTGENIKTYYGEDMYSVYDMIATNEEGTISMCCFIHDDEETKDLTEKEFLETTFSDSDYDEIKPLTIDGFEFQTVQLKFEDNGDDYIEYCYVYKVDNKFICFDYCYPTEYENKFEQMVKKV